MIYNNFTIPKGKGVHIGILGDNLLTLGIRVTTRATCIKSSSIATQIINIETNTPNAQNIIQEQIDLLLETI